MPDQPSAYLTAHPGDLITAELWNQMQIRVRQDIASQVNAAVGGVKDVDHSKNSDELAGKTLENLTDYILEKVSAQILKRSGYMQVFCNLNLGSDKPIQHNLNVYPLVDLYKLDYFEAVCAKGDKPEDENSEWVLFYLYHADERRLRIPGESSPINIEADAYLKFRQSWWNVIEELREQKHLSYDDNTTLDNLEVDFWRAMFQAPNDQFDPDSYCHSPWFEKCCGEKRTVGDLKSHGDFQNIYLKMIPKKTINFPLEPKTIAVAAALAPPPPPPPPPTAEANTISVETSADVSKTPSIREEPESREPGPTNLRVAQVDRNTIAITLLAPAVYPPALGQAPQVQSKNSLELPAEWGQRLPVMVLLKV
jgi:hypothetical protein